MMWPVIIFFVVLAANLFTDYRTFLKNKKVNHIKGLLLRIVGLAPSVYLLQHDWILGAALEAVAYMVLFNGLWGLLEARDWFYLGSTSKIDLLQKKFGIWSYVAQYVLLSVLMYLYFK